MTHTQDKALEAVLHSKQLPTLPVVASKLLALTSQEDTTLSDIANLIAQDMALSTKVLRVSNSSFYSFPQQIASINQAVSILGINAVRSLVLSFSFLTMGKQKKGSLFNFARFWERSLVGASAAKLVLEQVANANTDEIFTAGLLQNIGQLLFAITLPDQYDQVLQRVAEEGRNGNEQAIEREIIGTDHTTAGYEVAKLWGLPPILLAAIRHHHEPSSYSGSDNQMRQTINAVHLSCLIANIFTSDNPELFHKQFRDQAKDLLGLKVLAINTVLKVIDREVDKSAQFFGIKMPPVKSVAEILQEANLKLSLLNLSYEEMNRELIKSKLELEKLTQELSQKNRLLENLANIDGLTEVNNHRFFQNFLDSEINRSIRNERTISLLLADIDLFKSFNDTHGHQTGDFILREFCRITKEIIREYDLIARYGGEEFVYVLPETGPEEAMVVAEKLRQTVADYQFDDGRQTYRVTISIGVASASPGEADFKKNDFIGFADEALYDAKKSGRNKAVLYHPQKKKKWFSL